MRFLFLNVNKTKFVWDIIEIVWPISGPMEYHIIQMPTTTSVCGGNPKYSNYRDKKKRGSVLPTV